MDFKLKEICEQFIGEVSDSITQPLKGLISKYKVVFQMAEKDHLDCASLIDKQPWASAGQAHALCSSVVIPTQESEITTGKFDYSDLYNVNAV